MFTPIPCIQYIGLFDIDAENNLTPKVIYVSPTPSGATQYYVRKNGNRILQITEAEFLKATELASFVQKW